MKDKDKDRDSSKTGLQYGDYQRADEKEHRLYGADAIEARIRANLKAEFEGKAPSDPSEAPEEPQPPQLPQLNPSIHDEMVHSPPHYTGPLADTLGIEVIDVASALNLNGARFSILRYVCRAGKKGGTLEEEIRDLNKIIEYAEFEIRRLKGEPVSNTRRHNS